MSTLWNYTRREVQRRPARTILTLLGIAVGVATIVAITTTTRATRRAFRDMFTSVAGRAQLEIVKDGNLPFDSAPVERSLKDVEGVREVYPIIQNLAGLVLKDFVQPVLVLGVNPRRDQQVRTYVLDSGRFLENDNDVLIGAEIAKQKGIGVGSRVLLVSADKTPKFLIVAGLLAAEGAAAYDGGGVAVVTTKTAQSLFRYSDKVNSLQIVLAENADQAKARSVIDDRLRTQFPDLKVQSPTSRSKLAEHGTLSTEMALSSLSVVSLVAGAFVVLNSFLMSLGERRRQLAILRAIGTTRGQITRLLLREAVVLGVVGTALGIGLGALLTIALVAMQEVLLQVKLPPLQWTAEPFLMGIVVGPGMALLATWLPARKAGQRSPLEAMAAHRSSADQQKQWPRYAGLVLVGVALLLAVGFVMEWWPPTPDLLAPVMALILIGCVLALPLILKPLHPLMARALKPLLGVEGTIAFRQLERRPSRTSLTVGVLCIGVIVTVGFGMSLLDSAHDIETWFDDTLQADFYVRGSLFKSSPDNSVKRDAALADDIGKIDGVTRVRKTTFAKQTIDGQETVLVARDFKSSPSLSLSPTQGTEQAIRAGLAKGQIVLGTALAEKTKKHMGDVVTVEKVGEFEVAGIVKEYSAGGMACYLEWTVARDRLGVKDVHLFEVDVADGREQAVEAELRTFCDQHHLLLQTHADLKAFVDKNVDSVLGFLWCLIALMFVVASLGIINTLTMNVYEQTRELGAMRAIGLKRGQLRKLVLAQALGVAVLSIIPGIGVGLLMAWIMNVTTPALSGHHLEFHFHPVFIVLCAGIALVVSLLAASIPARRAARINVIQALQYE